MKTVKKKILIAGGTGLVGNALLKSLNPDEYEIFIFSRIKRKHQDGIKYIVWDPANGYIESTVNADIIINLAGAGIADERWTSERKIILVNSRTESAATLQKMLEKTGHKPELYISASAVGFYGDRNDEKLTEERSAGIGFLAECCSLWENAAMQLERYVNRLVILRIGLVLSLDGGALPKMVMTKNLRVYNYFGNGQQYYPWIHIDDLIRIIHFSISEKHISGIYNAVAPHPERNIKLMQIIRKLYSIPSILIPAPATALKLILGEMSAVVLNSNNVSAEKLLKTGFSFNFPDATDALKSMLD
jgi:uncharacterized protein